MAEGDNINKFVLHFRTHSHQIIHLERMPPDFPLEHLIRQRGFYLKTGAASRPLKLTARVVKDAIIDQQSEI